MVFMTLNLTLVLQLSTLCKSALQGGKSAVKLFSTANQVPSVPELARFFTVFWTVTERKTLLQTSQTSLKRKGVKNNCYMQFVRWHRRSELKKTLNAPHVKTFFFLDLEYEISVELSLILNRKSFEFETKLKL